MSDRGDLQILSETVMVEIPRGRDNKEVLRVSFTKARAPDGKDVAWYSIRVFWRDDEGQCRPGKQGVTIRGRELGAVAAALSKAVSGGGTASAAPKSPSPVEGRDSDEIPF